MPHWKEHVSVIDANILD